MRLINMGGMARLRGHATRLEEGAVGRTGYESADSNCGRAVLTKRPTRRSSTSPLDLLF
jgi:hypothetical protein